MLVVKTDPIQLIIHPNIRNSAGIVIHRVDKYLSRAETSSSIKIIVYRVAS